MDGGWTGGWMGEDGWMNAWVDGGWMVWDGWVDRWMGGCLHETLV